MGVWEEAVTANMYRISFWYTEDALKLNVVMVK